MNRSEYALTPHLLHKSNEHFARIFSSPVLIVVLRKHRTTTLVAPFLRSIYFALVKSTETVRGTSLTGMFGKITTLSIERALTWTTFEDIQGRGSIRSTHRDPNARS